MMSFNSIITILQKIIDVSLVWVLIYFVLKNLKNNVKLVLIFKGVLIVVLVKVLSDYLNLTTIGLLLEYVIMWGPLALIIIFQPEIRNILEHLGRKQILTSHKILTMDEREKIVYEIMGAVEYLRKARIGGLIVIERDTSLNEYINRSKQLYADISAELLISIFFPRNPLHDGGVIIQGDKITCAGSVFKTSMDPTLSKRLGTRHRAALGVAEETDAIALIVSEETGRISIAVNGNMKYNLTLEDFKMTLIDELKPKTEVFYDADDEEEGMSDNNA